METIFFEIAAIFFEIEAIPSGKVVEVLLKLQRNFNLTS